MVTMLKVYLIVLKLNMRGNFLKHALEDKTRQFQTPSLSAGSALKKYYLLIVKVGLVPTSV